MSVTSYYSFDGEIISEETAGVRRDYLTDALGSITSTVTSAGSIENTYRYKPYGEQLVRTGAGSDPKFLWNGKWGYRKISNSSSVYIRKRHYAYQQGRWLTVDPTGYLDSINIYLYVNGNSSTYYDYTGLITVIGTPVGRDKCKESDINEVQRKFDSVCSKLFGKSSSQGESAVLKGPDLPASKIECCVEKHAPGSSKENCASTCIRELCTIGRVFLDCNSEKDQTGRYICRQCPDTSFLMCSNLSRCDQKNYNQSITVCKNRSFSGKKFQLPKSICGSKDRGGTYVGCPGKKCLDYTEEFAILHEMTHVCANVDVEGTADNLGCCLLNEFF